MTNDELKAAWAANIDSKEKFDEVYRITRYDLPRDPAVAAMLPQNNQNVFITHTGNETWPLRRDMIREAIGMYPEPTSVLKWLRAMHSNVGVAQMFPHVSPVNNEEIAFTPDANQARADRKQRMSVGRFLRKVLLFVPDSEIQRLDQMHRAELDTTFKLAETIEAIEEVYMSMSGDSGCMRHSRSNWNLRDYHPSAVYASPNMGVAYLTDENNEIKSRAVVWVNPNDPDDKRYVRIYGDVILKKKLEMNGYRMRGLAGAKIRILHDSSHSDPSVVVMPWIDPAGGIHASNVDRQYDSEYAVRFKGEDCFTLLDSTQRRRYEGVGIQPASVQTTAGYVSIPELDPSTFHYVCAITGEQTNRMDVATSRWIDANGAIVQVRDTSLQGIDDLVTIRAQVEGRLINAFCTSEVRDKYQIPGCVGYYNDEDTRTAAGVCLLDVAFYGESQYGIRTECVFMEDAAGVRTYIRKADTLMLYSVDGDKFIHESMVKSLKKDGYLPIAVLNGYRGLAHKDHARMAVTKGGKRVIVTRHDVTMLVDKTWEYNRNVVQMACAGLSYNIAKTEDRYKVVVPKEFVVERFSGTYAFARRPDGLLARDRRMVQLFAKGFNNHTSWFKHGDTIVTHDYYNKATSASQFYEAALGILAMKDDAEWMQRTLGYQRAGALPWANIVKHAYEGMLEYDREYDLMMAEANAVEAVQKLAPEQLVAQINRLDDAGIDTLVAEVDEALATSVIRRWPRLQALGVPQVFSEASLTPSVAAALDQMEQQISTPAPADNLTPNEVVAARSMGATMVSLSGMNEAHHAQEPVPPAPNFTIVHPDDDLLTQLAAAGLTTVVVAE